MKSLPHPSYDPLGRVTRVESPGGGATETDYDDAGHPTEVRTLLDDGGTPADPADDTWSLTDYGYDEQGRLEWETVPHDPAEADPAKVNYTYDAAGNLESRSDPRNPAWVWSYTYDALNRRISETSPTGLTTATTYTLTREDPGTPEMDWSSTIEVEAPSHATATTTFDVLGRTIAEQVANRPPTTYEYDVVGNVTKVTDPAGVWTETDHDGFGQAVAVRTPAEGGGAHETAMAYDLAGNLVSTDGPRSPAGGEDQIDHTYDLMGRLTSSSYVMDPADPGDDLTTSFTYDDAGELVRATDPDQRAREWTYDLAGREASVTVAPGTADEAVWTRTYDEAGRLVVTADPRGLDLHQAYDPAGRLLRRWATGGPEAAEETFAYDEAGNQTRATREAEGGVPALTTAIAYDPDGRLSSVAQGGEETTYAYDDPATPGLLSSVTDPAGVTTYTYDPQSGDLASLTDPLTGLVSAYSYDAAGRPSSRTTGALTFGRTYEARTGRVAAQTVTAGAQVLFSADLTYDEAGNVTAKDIAQDGLPASEQGAWAYSYDPAGRMTASTDPQGVTTAYGWDGAGNRTSVKVGTAPAEITTYDAAGRPDTGTGGLTYTHDQAGNLTFLDRPGTGEDASFTYDPWGRTKTAAPGALGSPEVAYTYDALSRTTRRTEGLTETAYAYTGLGESLARVAESLQG
ncbi:MAG TPA: hypothetical protein VE173_05005, partial [Longimicrobiales bacterium]|nr:hypothetical protein [Longimicrobiales bacterium]